MAPDAGGTVEDVTATVAARVQGILSAAEREATALRHEVERAAEQRAMQIIVHAENEAQRLVREADAAAQRHFEETRQRLDSYAADRIQRMHAATERLLAAAEGLSERCEEAGAAQRAVGELLMAVAEVADAAVREVSGPLPPVSPPPVAPVGRAADGAT